jgi:glycolate oxidase subunit GlcD
MDRIVVEALRAIVGPQGLVEAGTRAIPYESDGLAIYAQRPDLVLLPKDTEQTAACLKVLHAARIPIVPRGAGTGLAGGATPVEGGVVLGTARMRAVLELDVANRRARVQAGLVNVDLSSACKAHGLYYAPDPSSQQACTLGGNVANNSGGPHCFKHGNTSQHVLGLLIVTENGERLDLTEPALDPEGYDLVGLFVGSEGMFGIATEIVLRLVPEPAVVETFLGVYGALEAACDAVSDIIAARLEPSALEILDKLTIEAVEASVFAAGYPREAEAVLLVEIEGSEAEVAATARAVRAILEQRGALSVQSARDAAARKKLWAGRKGAFGAMGRVAPDLYVADAVVPRTKLREMVLRTVEIARERGLRLATVFHAGDGNLHPNICYDRRDKDELARVLEAGDRMLELCVAAGGALTGEHGVGLEKQGQMHYLFSAADMRQMCRARDAWDPDRRMNPGKLIPVHVCHEMRAGRVPEDP